MQRKWVIAIGEYQLPFVRAINHVLNGDWWQVCPKCGQHTLRFYYHAWDQRAERGTMWAWCPACRMWGHVLCAPPRGGSLRDPYAGTSLDEFGQLEWDKQLSFIDHLDQL